ncbi:glycosyltransferase family 4 protein [Nocardioides euryhalodurans]|uniref:Glycosyltransferase family 1 protein n=1 Tax=Nocardioides euryhalodurans TaxID=2518370 RepID=A0A4P7GIB0_9ACTN|nr:glycosyltransferase family 1 protein [Nocardioides euryhalodurans]QBR91688.1 glycosyltransferase family 1 protein [Nocardioides euryhalodurans]
MRVAIVTESFLPQVNGVANSVRHVAEQLVRQGHQPLVVAPGHGPDHYLGIPVTRVRSVGLPGYRAFPLGLPDAALERALADFGPDVVHLASPIVVGAAGLRAARRLGVPTVAVYQTDIAGFARQYGVRAEVLLDRWVGRLHRKADRTLVPSHSSYRQLAALGVPDLHLWRRGVSLDLFDPSRRDQERHATLSHDGRDVLVGYVGRLAAEKQVRRLAEIAGIPGTRLVVVGEGPERSWLGRHLPGAHFSGQLGGTHLATAFASLDVFVHPGTSETFCQTVQEAQASGVPVVAAAAGGPLDLVEHGRTGLLFDPEDRFSLWRTVTAAVRDADLRSRMAAAAHAKVQDRTWPIVVEDLVERHYRAVLDQRRLAIA